MNAPPAAAVELELAPVTGRPGYYRATDAAGRIVVEASRQPLLDAARALVGAGLPPGTALTARHRGSGVVAARATIAEAVPWTVEETDRGGLRKRRWRPFRGADSFRDGAAENARPAVPAGERERPFAAPRPMFPATGRAAATAPKGRT